MKKTLFKDSVRTIKKSIVIFISIVVFSMLCVTLYNCLNWVTESIPSSIHDSMEQANLYDIRMLYGNNLSDEDLEKISEIDGVDEIEGKRQGYGTFIHNDNQYVQARIIEIGSSMNVPQNLEGKLPSAEDEVAVCKSWADKKGIKIGEKINFISDETGYDMLAQNELTVTAFMDTVEYNELNESGYGVSEKNSMSVGCILYVSEKAFNPILYNGNNLVLIKSDRLRGLSTFSDEYNTEVNNIKDNINKALEETELSGYVITDRTYLPTSVVPTNLILSLTNVKSILVSVFLIIGMLICYSSIIRMVSDQAYLIGTKLAMGITPGDIRRQYCLYTELAIVIGCISGGILGYGFSNIILNVCGKNYALPFICKVDIVSLIIICAFEIIIALFVTLIGVQFTLKKKIVALLYSSTEISVKKHFYERFSIWNKLSLFTRSVINNFFNEKKRVFETLVGVVGSTALLMISLIMYFDVKQSFDVQYSDYYKFDSYIFYDGAEETSEQIAEVLKQRNIPYANIMYTRNYMTKPNEKVSNANITVFDDKKALSKLVNIVPDDDKGSHKVYKDLWVSSAYHNYYGEKEADTIQFVSEDGNKLVPVEGFFKYHLAYYQMYIDSESYEEYMGKPFEKNAFIANISGKDKDELLDTLMEIPGYRMYNDYYSQSHNTYSTFEVVAIMLVVIYFVLAVILSLTVSLSVLDMFVKEKKRELITMMINGFSPGKAKFYIFSDTAFLTIIGIIIGVIFGGFMAIITIFAFENDIVSFIHEIPGTAIIISVTVVALIMVILCMIVQKKIGKFKLSDINETV